jgi:hypothetical protein
MTKPRILFWDIETTHNLAAVFKLFGEDYISHENIVQERYIVCGAWKWDGERQVHGVSVLDDPKRFKRDPTDDRHVVAILDGVLSQADIIVAHNGDKYDIKFHAARALTHGLPPLPPIASVDTLKVAKSRFLFNSNRLDYLGQLLGLGRKKSTPRGLWLDVLRGDARAVRTMLDYNKQDVILLEAVYRKLAPFVKQTRNHGIGCPRCSSHKIQMRGVHRTVSSLYQRYQCQDCGGWFRDTPAKTKSFKKVI